MHGEADTYKKCKSLSKKKRKKKNNILISRYKENISIQLLVEIKICTSLFNIHSLSRMSTKMVQRHIE